MKRILFLLIIPMFISGCQAQTDKKTENANVNSSEIPAPDNIKPKVDIKVNKKFDDNGNLIGYDSTYSWSYSTLKGDSVIVDADTVFSQFRPLFDTHFPDFDPMLNDAFFGLDSSFYHDFMNPGYFNHKWQQQLLQQENTFRKMDSLKNAFFNEHYPGLIKPGK